jgi:hypothetical protein
MNANVANILRCFWKAKPDELHHGLAWYAQAAGESCRRIPDYNRETVLGVVAALSPQTAWARNIKYAEMLIYEGRCPSTGTRMRTASDILAGANPAERLGGNKVRSFYECLRDQESDAVCVDGHAFSCWSGERIATSKCPRIGDKLYGVIADDFREAARVVGVRPHQVQAATWVTWRRLHGVRQEIDRDLGKERSRGNLRVRADGAHSPIPARFHIQEA